MTIEKEQLEGAVHKLADKIRSDLLTINDSMVRIASNLEDLEDIAIVLGRIDEPAVPWESMKKMLEEDEK
jgi:hypothetical protein